MPLNILNYKCSSVRLLKVSSDNWKFTSGTPKRATAGVTGRNTGMLLENYESSIYRLAGIQTWTLPKKYSRVRITGMTTTPIT